LLGDTVRENVATIGEQLSGDYDKSSKDITFAGQGADKNVKLGDYDNKVGE
jgi:hypothetical protein